MIKFGEICYIDQVMDLMEKCKEEMRRDDVIVWDDGYPNRDILFNDLQRNSIIYLIDNKVVGFIAIEKNANNDSEKYEINDNFLFIGRVMVDPEIQRSGIASKMIDYIFGLGYKAIHLAANVRNYKALGLYCKKGFNEIERKTYKYGEMVLLERVI